MRHAVELHLKGTAEHLIKFSQLRPPKIEFNLATSHDIGIIWNFIKSATPAIDQRYSIIVEKIDKIILDIAEIDPTGQTFRYAFDRESKKHLIQTSLINVKNLRQKFSFLENQLLVLNRLNDAIDDELRYGDRTSKLSRHDLFLIARALPIRENWGTTAFSKVKSTIQRNFNLSSNDFSRALTCIQSNYQMAHILGSPKPLISATLGALETFIDAWSITNNVAEYRASFSEKDLDIEGHPTDSINFLEETLEHEIKEHKAKKLINTSLTLDEMIDIQTLYLLTNDTHYGEQYVHTYNSYKLHATEHSLSIDKISENMLGRFRAPDQIIKSLYFLGQFEIAEHLIAAYDFESIFDWIIEARDGYLFKEPWTLIFSDEDVSKWSNGRLPPLFDH